MHKKSNGLSNYFSCTVDVQETHVTKKSDIPKCSSCERDIVNKLILAT